ncbi:hypothetical protein [Humibacter sp.]|uniref:hypothetical protein n=1 Tax=Humibacter sp. TaxID=1940291 RepID=UPI003F7FC89B
MPDEPITAPPALVPNLAEPDRYRPEAPDDLVSRAREFIASARWVWAKTMPWAPHWYVLRRQSRRDGYDALRALIREYHYPRVWRKRTFRGITLSGLHLWIMDDDPGTDNGGTVLINAKPAAADDWPDEQPKLFEHS